MATATRARSSFETSLLQSLSTIQKNSSRSRSRSRPRRHSNGNVPSRQPSPKTRHPQGQRRATVSGPAPTFGNLNEHHVPLTPTTGILKSHNDADIIPTPSQSNRVSFSHREDGSIRNKIASFDTDASPKESVETKRRSLRDSMNWPPPPPPPRPDTSCTKRPSGNRAASLPFRTGPVRRYSMLEMEERRKDEIEEQESSAAVIPPLPFSRRRTDGDYDIPSQPTEIQVYSGARNDYSLGDKARCTSHMIIRDDPQEAFHQVSRLKQHDFAFVKRTDGLWTYAILAHRYIDEGEECMMFVMHQVGSTKTIKKNQWAGFVRLVAVEEEMMEEEPLDPTLPRNIFVDSRARDDCSLISFFSNN